MRDRLLNVAFATLEFTLRDLAVEADEVAVVEIDRLVGTFLSERAVEWLGNELFPYRRYSARAEALLGNGSHDHGHIEIWALGGAIDDLSVAVENEVAYSPGERAVVFLSKDNFKFLEFPERAYVTLGFDQGRLPVLKADGQDYVVVDDPEIGQNTFPLAAFLDVILTLRNEAGGGPVQA